MIMGDESLGFGLFAGQMTQFKDVTVGCVENCDERFFDFFHQLNVKKIIEIHP